MKNKAKLDERIRLALSRGWKFIPPQEQIHGGSARVVKEACYYHAQSGRICYVPAQLPSYEENPELP